MAAIEKYHLIAKNLSSDHIESIIDYYNNWKGQNVIPLNYRFIKIFAKNLDAGRSKWYLLHKLINKRRITNSALPRILNSVIDENIIPLRIFQSTVEWLSPHELWNNPHHDPWILRSGFIPFENDENLEISIKTAQALKKHLDKNSLFIYSGNKSVHVWYPFDLFQLISDKSVLSNAKKLEKAEREERYKFFKKIQSKIDYELDNRISADTRRVVPIIGSVNGLTGRKVISIDSQELDQLTTRELTESSNMFKNQSGNNNKY